MDSISNFETSRLIAHCFSLNDYDTLCQLHSDPQVMATLGGIRPPEKTRQFLAEKMAHWGQYGFGYWMFHHRETGQFVGRGGIQHIEIGGQQEVEIGYTVASTFWGQGYATEIAKTLVDLGFETLDLPEIVCFTLATNTASQRVMEKVGFQFERNVRHEEQTHVLYRLHQP
ncbi:MAG: GNAT family N-acetyltransferase [Chloroflexota bacterium]